MFHYECEGEGQTHVHLEKGTTEAMFYTPNWVQIQEKQPPGTLEGNFWDIFDNAANDGAKLQ